MALLDLCDELLLAIINEVALDSLVNFVRTCKQVCRIAETRLKRHQEMMAKHSCLFIHPRRPSRPNEGVWYVDHCVEALDAIVDDPTIGHYIRKVIYIPLDDSIPHFTKQDQQCSRNKVFEDILHTYGLDRDDLQSFQRHLREGLQTAYFGLLLLQADNLNSLAMSQVDGERWQAVSDILQARGNALLNDQSREAHPGLVLPKLKSVSMNIAGSCWSTSGILGALLNSSAVRDVTLSCMSANGESVGSWDSFCKVLRRQDSVSTLKLYRSELSAGQLARLAAQVPQLNMLEYTHKPDFDLYEWQGTWTAPGTRISEEALLLKPLAPPLEEVWEELVASHGSLLKENGWLATLQGEFPKQKLEMRRALRVPRSE